MKAARIFRKRIAFHGSGNFKISMPWNWLALPHGSLTSPGLMVITNKLMSHATIRHLACSDISVGSQFCRSSKPHKHRIADAIFLARTIWHPFRSTSVSLIIDSVPLQDILTFTLWDILAPVPMAWVERFLSGHYNNCPKSWRFDSVLSEQVNGR